MSCARGMSAPPNMFCWISGDSLHIMFSSHSKYSTFSLLHWIDAEIKWAQFLCGFPEVKFSLFWLFYNSGVHNRSHSHSYCIKTFCLQFCSLHPHFLGRSTGLTWTASAIWFSFNNSALSIFPNSGKSLKAMKEYWSLMEVQKENRKRKVINRKFPTSAL